MSTRDEWLRARKNYITASDCAAVLGLDPNKTAGKVMADKLSDKLEDELKIVQVAAGRHLERAAIAWFAEDHPLYDVAPWPVGKLLVSPELPCLAATPDATIDGILPLEIKNVGFEQRPNWHEDGQVKLRNGDPIPRPWVPALPAYAELRWAVYPAQPTPSRLASVNEWRATLRDMRAIEFGELCAPDKYWVQLQIQAHCMGATEGWISGVMGGTSRIDLQYEADRAFIDWALPRLAAFWEKVEAKRGR